MPPLPHRVVDQIKIDMVELELAQTRVERSLGVSMIGIPQFCRDENLLPWNPALSNRGAHTLLVAVQGGGIDVPVARFEGGKHRCFTHRTGAGLPHAQTELRYELTIVEC